ncbi:MAG: diaminopropionate ammonia-lyase [Synergistaceae bacterium]|jgi:diaminopropionate ammonia-lyase|nr:diaminopropionate ammonia-lyase [Synergistaceae bacterium]
MVTDVTREKILWISNEGTIYFKKPTSVLSAFDENETRAVRGFHATIPGYEPTPLCNLKSLAETLGIGGLYLKDESFRFGLNAFKALGGVYAIARYLAGRLGRDISRLSCTDLMSEETKKITGDVTFATTTDGNHGRGVAWTARLLHQKAVVRMPKGSSKHRCELIANEGASVTIRDVNYDESVRLTAQEASGQGWVVVQDTAWPGYEEIPLWIMKGYGTMVDEAIEQMSANGAGKPTHVFIQAGVGSLAGAVQAIFRNRFPERPPRVIVAESNRADCYYRSAIAGDGRPRAVTGDLDTLMAGLACGEANSIAFDILRDYASAFVSCPDYVAARGMRVLGNPLAGDPRVCSGESGALTAGLLTYVMQDESLAGLRDALKLDKNSTVVLFSTEGDTDPSRYRRVVWDGEFPTCEVMSEPTK